MQQQTFTFSVYFIYCIKYPRTAAIHCTVITYTYEEISHQNI